MKTQYVCDKCGKVFTDYSEALRCEYSHSAPDLIWNWEFAEGDEFYQYVYTSGKSAPTVVYMKVPVLDENGYRVLDENDIPVEKVYPFKRLAHDAVCEAMEESMRKRYIADHKTTEEIEEVAP